MASCLIKICLSRLMCGQTRDRRNAHTCPTQSHQIAVRSTNLALRPRQDSSGYKNLGELAKRNRTGECGLGSISPLTRSFVLVKRVVQVGEEVIWKRGLVDEGSWGGGYLGSQKTSSGAAFVWGRWCTVISRPSCFLLELFWSEGWPVEQQENRDGER